MYCPSCGASNVEYGASCISCGRPLPATGPGRQAQSSAAAQPPEGRAERRPVAAWAVVAILVALVPLIGILAAVAIPAYQNYTIRAQVSEGLALAIPHKSAVVAAWESSGHDFEGIYSRPIGPVENQGKYVESVDIVAGAIVITYSRAAYSELRGRTLTIVPALDAAAQSVEWQCGRGAAPAGFESIFEEPSRLTDVPDAYLPSGCRRP